ncbi:hypothetical protein [Devosia elaeis]|uniref:Nuclease n=1 Tax=Devosia elaeis TaxID=1770058 RepID=A0A178HY55_9HYPH|nr:hypothetical protein [Devosia elaeis]OAM77761.1 hypothetical protein A3840_08425 [Devosia elaeis]
MTKHAIVAALLAALFAAPAFAQTGKCVIKGNVNTKGEKIYHVPGQRYYDDTRIQASHGERWFCSEAEARAAGWRKARV